MKPILQIFLVLLLSLGACTEPLDYNSEEVKEAAPSSKSNIITPEEAVIKASEAYTYFTGKQMNPQSRSKMGVVFGISTPHSRATGSDTIAYIVNYPDSGGYCIIASNPLVSDNYIAFVENGHLTSLDDIEVEPQRLYLNTVLANLTGEHKIRSRVEKLDPIPMPIETVKIDSAYRESGDVSNLNWGQEDIFGRYCENGVCGCAPLAMALTMAKMGTPASLWIDFTNTVKPSYSGTITFDWNDIRKLHNVLQIKGPWNDNPTSESINNVELLVRELGEMANTKYYAATTVQQAHSATDKNDTKRVVKTLFPNKIVKGYIDLEEPELFEDVLKNGAIILRGNETTTGSGHVWIAEKYKFLSRTVHHYFDGVYSHTDHSFSKTAYMNWGWNGQGNGYYDLTYHKKTFYVQPFQETYEKIELITIQ